MLLVILLMLIMLDLNILLIRVVLLLSMQVIMLAMRLYSHLLLVLKELSILLILRSLLLDIVLISPLRRRLIRFIMFLMRSAGAVMMFLICLAMIQAELNLNEVVLWSILLGFLLWLSLLFLMLLLLVFFGESLKTLSNSSPTQKRPLPRSGGEVNFAYLHWS